MDIFREKVTSGRTHFRHYFDDYKGEGEEISPEDAQEFIASKFRDLLSEKRLKTFYRHFTCATDTNNIKTIFDILKAKILHDNLNEIGLY